MCTISRIVQVIGQVSTCRPSKPFGSQCVILTALKDAIAHDLCTLEIFSEVRRR